MKTLYLSIIIVAIFVLFTGIVIFLILPFQNQPHGYMLVQTDTIPKNSSSIHTCTSEQEQLFDPGPSGFTALMCPFEPHMYTKVVDYSGFDDICHDKKYDANNYFLNAGHDGTFAYQIYLDVPISDIFRSPYVDMTNYASFSHYYTMAGGIVGWNYNKTLDGVNVSFEPKSEVLWPWGSTLVTAKISASTDAKGGSHWLVLSPGPCGGGPSFILTINNTRMN